MWWVGRMRRPEMTIHVAFAPMRLSSLHLKGAYEMVVALIERSVLNDIVECREDAKNQGERRVRRSQR